MKRFNSNKRRSARSFNRQQPKSHAFNFRIQRGGWRL